jgi:excisionase family DNA binding protein
MDNGQTQKSQPEAEYRTAKWCADYLGCSVGAIWHWKRIGKLPFYACGRVVRFKRQDIDRLMQHRKAQ